MKIRFFASRLKYSRWVEVSLVPNERVETLVRALLEHFVAFGGIPLLAIFDRPRTIALKWDKAGRVTEWNSTFRDAVFRLGMGVELCWAYSPQQKGSVENLVGWVKGSFFSQRRFHDEADLAEQLAQWLYEVNHLRPSRATGRPPVELVGEDRARFRPVPIDPEEFDLVFATSVGPTAEVPFEGALYDMVPDAIGLPATLHVFPTRIRIVAGRFQAVHPRYGPGGRSRLPEHRAERLAAVSGERGKRYLMRQDILELGADAAAYLTELVHRRPNRWGADIKILYRLLIEYGPDPLREAIRVALGRGTVGAEYVEWVLDQGEPFEPWSGAAGS
jgi:YD repeat-containing protein